MKKIVILLMLIVAIPAFAQGELSPLWPENKTLHFKYNSIKQYAFYKPIAFFADGTCTKQKEVTCDWHIENENFFIQFYVEENGEKKPANYFVASSNVNGRPRGSFYSSTRKEGDWVLLKESGPSLHLSELGTSIWGPWKFRYRLDGKTDWVQYDLNLNPDGSCLFNSQTVDCKWNQTSETSSLTLDIPELGITNFKTEGFIGSASTPYGKFLSSDTTKSGNWLLIHRVD